MARNTQSLLIHFEAAIDGDQRRYALIVETLEKMGHRTTTHHYLHRRMSEILAETPAESAEYVQKVQNWIRSAELIIIETTKSDMSIGFEAAYALHLAKPVIVLYHTLNGTQPYSLKGWYDDRLVSREWSEESLETTLTEAICEALEAESTRMHLALPNRMNAYLQHLALKQKKTKTAILRSLIEEKMKSNRP